MDERFDLSDVAREATLVERLHWTERQLLRALAQRRFMFVSGVRHASDLLDAGHSLRQALEEDLL